MSYVFEKNGFAYKSGELVKIDWLDAAYIRHAYQVTSRLDFRLAAHELCGVCGDRDRVKIQNQLDKKLGRFNEIVTSPDIPRISESSTMLDFVYLFFYDAWLSDVWRGELRNQRGRGVADNLFEGDFISSLDMFSLQDIRGADLYDPVPNYETVAQVDFWRCAMLAAELMFSLKITMEGRPIDHEVHESRKERYMGFMAKEVF